MHFKNHIYEMLQGLCYWMGYRNAIYPKHLIAECSCVDIAIEILVAQIDTATYSVDKEVPYSSFGIKDSKKRAGLAIKNKQTGKYECVLEFKVADTNGGYLKDLQKMAAIKSIS